MAHGPQALPSQPSTDLHGTANTIGKVVGVKDSGGLPVALATAGVVVNGLAAPGGNIWMHNRAENRGVVRGLASGHERQITLAEQTLGQMYKEMRWVFGAAGLAGLGLTVASGVEALNNYHGEDDKALWFVESFLPVLGCLYTLGSSLFTMTLHLHRTPPAFIRAKTFPTAAEDDAAQAAERRRVAEPAAAAALASAARASGGNGTARGRP